MTPPPAALPRGVIILLGSAGAVVTIAGLVAFAAVIGPVFLGLMITVAVHPLLGRLQRLGWPGWLAVTVTVLSSFAIVLGLAVALALSIAQLATLLPSYQDRFTALLDEAGRLLAASGIGTDQVRAVLAQFDFGALARLVGSLLIGLAGALSGMLFILSVLLFMGLDAAGFPHRLRSVARERSEIVGAFATFARGTRSYLVVSTVFGAIVAVVDIGVLWAMGIPLALTWGLLAFITNFIPNIGFVIGLVPPALLGLLEGGPVLMIWVIVAYGTINFVIQSVIQPKYVGDAVDLSLTLTFLSLVFWSWVLGPLGAVLAIPLTLLTKALLVDIDPTTRWLSALLTSSRPAEEEATP
jgi:AI-2 transport protein TqsA